MWDGKRLPDRLEMFSISLSVMLGGNCLGLLQATSNSHSLSTEISNSPCQSPPTMGDETSTIASQSNRSINTFTQGESLAGYQLPLLTNYERSICSILIDHELVYEYDTNTICTTT